MKTDVTFVYQTYKDGNYSYEAFHLKDITTEKLKSEINSRNISVLEHIIVYERSFMKDTDSIIYGNRGKVEFFEKWGIEF